jgi:hypothetical protein
MSKRTRHNFKNLVRDPRYGVHPQPSSHHVSLQELQKCWIYREHTIFPETAIPADINRQILRPVPRRWYVDMLRQCQDCKRRFLFFAEEQRHWYEDLGFPTEADCVRCPECRKTERTLRNRFNRFSKRSTLNDLDDESLAQHITDAAFLWEHGVLKKEEKLRRLNKLAQRRIPDHAASRTLAQLLVNRKHTLSSS